MNFYIGQKVVCIASGGWYSANDDRKDPGPKKDEILIVDFLDYTPGDFGLGFNKYDTEEGFAIEHFRPLLTDSIEYAEKLVKELEIEINEENLVTA
ncbi:MAG: hypothetical protein V4721_10435 [Bacteroidota bacterium]